MVDFSGGTWRSLIDGSEVSAIPDAQDLLGSFDSRQIELSNNDSVSSWSDETGNDNTLTANSGEEPEYRTDEVEGLPAVYVDPNNDRLSVDVDNVSPPYTIFILVQQETSAQDADYISFFDDDSSAGILGQNSADEYRLRTSLSDLRDGSFNTDPAILGGVVNGSDSVLRYNGEGATGTLDDDDLQNITVNGRKDRDTGDYAVVEILVYDGDKSDIADEIEGHLDRDTSILS